MLMIVTESVTNILSDDLCDKYIVFVGDVKAFRVKIAERLAARKSHRTRKPTTRRS